MDGFEIGALVVLTSGSMRMAVEAVDGDRIACVWCHEGRIGRDTFAARLLKKWEVREDDSRPARSEGGGRPFRGDREGGGRPFRERPAGAADSREERPRGKPGWDGKPREKKFFRKDS